MRTRIKAFWIAAFFCAFAGGARAQTTVSGTFHDPNGITYGGGVLTAQLITPGGAQPTINGQPIQTSIGPTTLNPDGSMPATNFPSTNLILPSPSQWSITVCSLPNLPSPGLGPQCGTIKTNVTGASQDISTAMNAVLPAISQVPSGGAVAFSAITNGTATGKTFTMGAGSLLTFAAGGQINASECNGGPCGSGTIAGSIAVNQVAFGSGANAIQGSNALTYNGTNFVLSRSSTDTLDGLFRIQGIGAGNCDGLGTSCLLELGTESSSSYGLVFRNKIAPSVTTPSLAYQFLDNDGTFNIQSLGDANTGGTASLQLKAENVTAFFLVQGNVAHSEVGIDLNGNSNGGCGSSAFTDNPGTPNFFYGLILGDNGCAGVSLVGKLGSDFSLRQDNGSGTFGGDIEFGTAGDVSISSVAGQFITLGHTVEAGLLVEAPIFMTGSRAVKFLGSGGGEADIQCAAVCGSPNAMNLPTTTGAANSFLSTDGGNPQQLSWQTVAGSIPASNFLSCTQANCASSFANITNSFPVDTQYNISSSVGCVNSTAAATVVLQVRYTDVSSTLQTLITPTATCTTLGASSISQINQVVRVKAGTAFAYFVTAVNSPTYEASVALVQQGIN